jgi:hypothetical protein
MHSALLLDVVGGQRAVVLELLASEGEALLARGDALLVLDLGLDDDNRVRGIHVQRNCLARQRLDEYLVAVSGSVAGFGNEAAAKRLGETFRVLTVLLRVLRDLGYEDNASAALVDTN